MSETGSGQQGQRQEQPGGQPPGRRDEPAGQRPGERTRYAEYGEEPRGPGRQGEPDVLLDVPDLRVESIRLAVDDLRADLSLKARLANLVQLDAGVRVDLHGVELDITDVRAEAVLKVRLEELRRILDRALTTIERNPQIIETLAGSVGGVVDDVHRSAQQVTGSTEHLDMVVDRLGKQIGSISAQARYQGPEAVVQQAAKGGQEQRGGGQQQGGGGEVGQRQQGGGTPGGGQAEQARPGGAPGPPGGGQGQQPGGGGQPGGAGPGRPEQGAQGAGQGRPGGGQGAQGAGGAAPNPADLAAQASEALRQAGRSVWEAIQSGVSQHRPR
ncbi:hypothetical protein [Micromonospora sp. S4605]|uniref:hypothetical protein n=1 Tax=Micromonospora sp. S4605 TaxID=1420897 RepID=UPI0018EE7C7A|nr:hypothetical protein [Micromonospora sp. S4605]